MEKCGTIKGAPTSKPASHSGKNGGHDVGKSGQHNATHGNSISSTHRENMKHKPVTKK